MLCKFNKRAGTCKYVCGSVCVCMCVWVSKALNWLFVLPTATRHGLYSILLATWQNISQLFSILEAHTLPQTKVCVCPVCVCVCECMLLIFIWILNVSYIVLRSWFLFICLGSLCAERISFEIELVFAPINCVAKVFWLRLHRGGTTLHIGRGGERDT